MVLYRPCGNPEDGADVCGAFPFLDPLQALKLPVGEAEAAEAPALEFDEVELDFV